MDSGSRGGKSTKSQLCQNSRVFQTFLNGEAVGLVTKRAHPARCVGVITVFDQEINCTKINVNTDKPRTIDATWCDENPKMYRAKQKDSLAGYQLYFRGSTRIERLQGLCHSADSGYALAEAEVGRLYRWGLLGVKQDFTKAYLWYWRANAQNPSMWQDELNEVLRKAPSIETLSSAEGVHTEGQGDQCERDLVPKGSPH
jgi:hypothetical protein